MRVLLAVLLLIAVAVAVAEDRPRSFKEVKAAAEGGDKNAQHNLGVMYVNGEGVRRNDAEAVKWFRKAAEQGLAAAQFTLGFMYARGEGVPKDYAESYAWVSIAATNGVEDVKKKVGKSKGRTQPRPTRRIPETSHRTLRADQRQQSQVAAASPPGVFVIPVSHSRVI